MTEFLRPRLFESYKTRSEVLLKIRTKFHMIMIQRFSNVIYELFHNHVVLWSTEILNDHFEPLRRSCFRGTALAIRRRSRVKI